MSSRVYRRKYGKDDLQEVYDGLLQKTQKKASDVENSSLNEDSASPEDFSDTKHGTHTETKSSSIDDLSCRSKGPENKFVLNVCDDDDDEAQNDSDEIESKDTVTITEKPNKKKKKKKKGKKQKVADVDIDVLLDVKTDAIEKSDYTGAHPMHSFNPLAVNVKNLNPDNEVKRRFGQQVVGADQRKKSHKTYKKTSNLVSPKVDWPPMSKAGLDMNVVEQRGDHYIFSFEHKPEYQRIQERFWTAVDTMSPENLMAVLRLTPYHIDTLLQLSEVCKMSEDPQMAAELIERALYAYESSFHPLFNIMTGKCRLDYKVWENRGFFLALYRHITAVGNRGCYRTSLEYCKLLLGLDPDNDPLCVLLLIDFYALRSDEYDYLKQLYELWNASRNLRALPNFAYSVPLALFHTSEEGSPDRNKADLMLQESLMMFPGVLLPLLDHCGVNTEADKNINKFFGASIHSSQPASLKQLTVLYVERTSSCWKAPECIAWLEENVQIVCSLASSDHSKFKSLTERGKNLYKAKTPLNVCRHLLISDIKKAISDLPAEITSQTVLSYDPLPPADTVRGYQRRNTTIRQIENQGFFQAFINSLRPDFNVNAVLDADEAAGAAGPQQHGNLMNLMGAVREMLNNIQFAPGPRDDEGQDDEQQEWD